MITVSTVFKISEDKALAFEDGLRAKYDVVSFRHLPNTEKLYEDDPHFKRIIKEIKKLSELRDEYINEKGC